MMRTVKRLAAIGLGLFLTSFLLGQTSISGKRSDARRVYTVEPPGPTAQSKGKPARTEDLFRTNCARCHGADGRGDTPLGHTYFSPDFTDNAWWQKHSDITSTRSLVSIISNGRGGMPGFGKKLKTSDIKALVNYVRRFRNSRSKIQETP
jgi:mono/diheme cytochrome c family protein